MCWIGLQGIKKRFQKPWVLVLHVRPGGFLAAVPIGLVPGEVLAVGNGPSPPGAVGPMGCYLRQAPP